ncbi:GNAT family N-acetyltransferase [Natronomonas sp.]|uniref:GNAT family N-acetyltransferase n=1 Tax=Natronomonas sp. TaxID=2184060 RepID=UPI0026336C2D|nr:GNAT family N-acetyltransferase [Natronomonas sp.]
MEIERIDGKGDEDGGGEGDVADAMSVRRAVFVDEQGVPEDVERDGKDAEAIHFVAYDDGDPIGAARLREAEAGAAKIERVAVRPARRGEGIGRRLMSAAEDAAAREGYRRVVLHAQASVVAFYLRMGYETVGERFEEAGIDHQRMEKPL